MSGRQQGAESEHACPWARQMAPPPPAPPAAPPPAPAAPLEDGVLLPPQEIRPTSAVAATQMRQLLAIYRNRTPNRTADIDALSAGIPRSLPARERRRPHRSRSRRQIADHRRRLPPVIPSPGFVHDTTAAEPPRSREAAHDSGVRNPGARAAVLPANVGRKTDAVRNAAARTWQRRTEWRWRSARTRPAPDTTEGGRTERRRPSLGTAPAVRQRRMDDSSPARTSDPGRIRECLPPSPSVRAAPIH